MIDYLLKFESKEQAVEFAIENGYSKDVLDEEGNEIKVPAQDSKEHLFTVIGENFIPTGETETLRDESGNEWEQPLIEGDGKHWVLFRDLTGKKDRTFAEDHIVWSSDSKEARPDESPKIDFA